MVCVFFFFKQKTAYEMRISDWSSDVCSSDLHFDVRNAGACIGRRDVAPRDRHRQFFAVAEVDLAHVIRERHGADVAVLADLAALRESFNRGLRRAGRDASRKRVGSGWSVSVSVYLGVIRLFITQITYKIFI